MSMQLAAQDLPLAEAIGRHLTPGVPSAPRRSIGSPATNESGDWRNTPPALFGWSVIAQCREFAAAIPAIAGCFPRIATLSWQPPQAAGRSTNCSIGGRRNFTSVLVLGVRQPNGNADRMNVGRSAIFCDESSGAVSGFPPDKAQPWLRFGPVGDFQLAPREQVVCHPRCEEGIKLWSNSDAKQRQTP